MKSNLSRSTVRVYGALTALGGASTDPLDRLLPFFEPLMRPTQGQKFDVEEFAKSVRQAYKWNFNTDLVEVLIPRLLSAGWVKSESPEAPTTSYIVSLPDRILSGEVENSAERELRSVSERFQEFARDLSPLMSIPRSIEEFEDILIEWLIYVEAYNESSLDYRPKTIVNSEGKMVRVVDVPEITGLSDEERFLCAKFVESAVKTDPETAETLTRIASIGLLTEVVQDFIKPVAPIEASNLVVYLDAPVAMELIGVSGKAARDNMESIVSELTKLGVQIRIFGLSVDEIRQNLTAVLSNPNPTGPTAQAIARGEVLRDFVTQICADPEHFLKLENVSVRHRTLEQYPGEHSFFTEDQRLDLYSSFSFQTNPTARDTDATVCAFVIRERRGHESTDIFKSRAILLTRNGLLPQIVRRRCIESRTLRKSSIPAVVHRRVLTASIWLRTGLGGDDLDIPKRLLLASCERVLEIKPGVVEAVKKITASLGDEEKSRQLELLLSKPRSAQMLMDKTLGASTAVTKENIDEIFQEMLYPHIESERKSGQANVKQERQKGVEKVKRVQSKLTAVEAERDEVRIQLSRNLEENRVAVEALFNDAQKTMRFKMYSKRVLGFVLAVFFCLPPVFQPGVWQSYITFLFAIPLAYLTITGGKMFPVEPSAKHAIKTLRYLAKKRGLASVVDRYNVSWDKNSYRILNDDHHSFD